MRISILAGTALLAVTAVLGVAAPATATETTPVAGTTATETTPIAPEGSVTYDEFIAALKARTTAFAANVPGKTQVMTVSGGFFGDKPLTTTVNPDGSLTSNMFGEIKCVTATKCWSKAVGTKSPTWYPLKKGSVTVNRDSSDLSLGGDPTAEELANMQFSMVGDSFFITETDSETGATTVIVATVTDTTYALKADVVVPGQEAQSVLAISVTLLDAPVKVTAPKKSQIKDKAISTTVKIDIF